MAIERRGMLNHSVNLSGLWSILGCFMAVGSLYR